MLDKLAGALKNAAKEKTKSLVKKIFTGSVPTLVVLIGGACTVTALVGAIVGIVSAVFSPFTNKYQKDAAYTQISSYGGAYKALDDGLLELEKSGVNYKTIFQAFSYEASSYDSAASTITIPDISTGDYKSYAGGANDSNKDVSGEQNTVEVNWDQSSFTYQYRMHWQYLLTLACISKFGDDAAMEKQIEAVAENMNDDGVVENPDKLGLSLVSADDITNMVKQLNEHGLNTNVEFFTQYVSDDVQKWIENDGLGSTVNFTTDSDGGQIGDPTYSYALSVRDNYSNKTNARGEKIFNNTDYLAKSGFPYSAYCYPAWNNGSTIYNGVDRGRTDRYLSGTNVSTNMTYSSDYTYLKNNKYDRGTSKGDYSYVYYDGKVYPVCLVREASNWLCKWSDFEYVKVKDDDKNTHYELVSFKKTYRIGDLIKCWEDMGIDSSLYQFMFDIMSQIEDVVGGTVGAEFQKAYDAYDPQTGEELTYQYKNPSYYSGTISEEDKEFTNSSAYAKVLNNATTSVNLEGELQAIYDQQTTKYVPSARIGLQVATVMYDGKMCYQRPHYYDGENKLRKYGYYAGLWSSSTKGADYYRPKVPTSNITKEGFGTMLRDGNSSGSNGFDDGERIGLCAAGFVNFILKDSIFQETRNANSDSHYPTAEGVRMLDIYKEADYRFQNSDELVVGDIALLSIVEGSDALEDEKNNVIAYYAGIEGGNHIFYACLSPDNPYSDYYGGSVSYVQKISLEDSAKYTKVDLKYFCRYYYGFTKEDGKADAYGYVRVVKEFSTNGSTLTKQMFNIYSSVSKMASEYLDSSHKVNTGTGDYVLCSVNRKDELLEYMNKASPQLFGDRTSEVYEHILNGILENGTGDDGYCGIDFEDTKYMTAYKKLSTGVMQLPLHSSDGFTGYITSWYGWRSNPTSDAHERAFHNGMDLWTTTGESTKVYGISEGEVVDTGYNNSCGNYIIIDYGDNIKSSYFHLSRVLVNTGDKVNSDTVCGYMGTTGDSTGVHLHLELRDGEIHEGTVLYAHPDWGARPDIQSRKETIDPYLYFPELDNWNLSGDLEGTRPDITRGE